MIEISSGNVPWMGYVPIAISEKADEIRRKRGWSKSKLVEMAIRAFVGQVGDYQDSPEKELPEGFEYAETKTGRTAIRPVEEVEL